MVQYYKITSSGTEHLKAKFLKRKKKAQGYIFSRRPAGRREVAERERVRQNLSLEIIYERTHF
jgi:hypothetical protein